jgi:orotate phosphoribosyltransferase-like protein
MVISDFTEIELEYFRVNCNFKDLERKLFESRAKGKSLLEIATELHISIDYARKISQKVNRKIIKVI